MDTPKEKDHKKKSKGLIYALSLAGQVSLLLVGPVAVCLSLGLWLDNVMESSPALLIIGTILGFAVSIVNVFRVMKIIEKIGE